MRPACLLVVLGVVAAPAFAEQPASGGSVVVLRGSGAPPTPWYRPPPEPTVQTVYLPVYYISLPLAYGVATTHRPAVKSASRNR
ncbi:MAG: hypothetical protein FJX11_19445 [Alphaproteobacteria bacterium]|nr:hypothetical protein [Alphaproteobacteria bacterium]